MAQQNEQRQVSYAEELRRQNAELERLRKSQEQSVAHLKASNEKWQKENEVLKDLITNYQGFTHQFKKQASRDERAVDERVRAFERDRERWKSLTEGNQTPQSTAASDFQKAFERWNPTPH
jgi:hypothetical protein